MREKPAKPKNCPLTPSGGGSWVKKIKGKLYTFGPWHDLEAALKRYYSQIDFILANGSQPVESDVNERTVEELANRFLEEQDSVQASRMMTTTRSPSDTTTTFLRHAVFLLIRLGKAKLLTACFPRTSQRSSASIQKRMMVRRLHRRPSLVTFAEPRQCSTGLTMSC